jgi:CheY-like chemotaxis protein
LISENITLRTRLDSDLGLVEVDPGQIEQVLMNLVVNARDAMPNGGRLTIETANTELDEQCGGIQPPLKPGRYALLTVSDTGGGMEWTTQARLFEPFFTTKEPGKGVGLGLATCYGIVKQSGVSIRVYSEPGRGSSFMIYLPLQAKTNSQAETLTPVEPCGGEEVILVAEDEECVRLLLRNLLEGKGYTVLEGGNGEEAMEIARCYAKPISLLLTDLVMPRMGGRELAERFSAMHPEARVLFMSGYTDDLSLRESLVHGEMEFIQKPYTMNMMLGTVRRLLDQAKERRTK